MLPIAVVPPDVREPEFDRVQASRDLIELLGQSVGRDALRPPPGALDERRGDRRHDDGQEADPDQHHKRGDQPAALARWHEVSVTDGRHRLDRPPQAVTDVGEVLIVGEWISTPATIVPETVTDAMILAARGAVSGLPDRTFIARGWGGGGAASLPAGVVMIMAS